MNYYEHHLGDYVRDTAHLSTLEDGTYRRLLDAYYIRELPLPVDLRECCKLARATSTAERKAVAYVLSQFFDRQPDGYHQARADEELARFQGKRDKARASADARWSSRRPASERNANADATAYANASSDGMRTHSERIENAYANGMPPAGARAAHPGTGAHPSPVPNNQTPEEKGRAEGIPQGVARAPANAEPERQPTRAGAACMAMRQAGLTSVNPSDPRLLALLEQGATDAELAAMAGEAVAKGKGWAWLLAAVQGRRSEAAAISLAPPAAATVTSSEAERTAAYLRSQQLTPEQRQRSNEAREAVMAKHRRTA